MINPDYYDEICSYLDKEKEEGKFDTISYILYGRRRESLGEYTDPKSAVFVNRT
jgi:hypothetical protein